VSDLIAIAYPDRETAEEVAGNAFQLQKSHELALDDLVVVEHQVGGKIKLHQPSMAGAGAAGGALWGGLIGLLFLAPLLGMAVGAAAGAAGGAMADAGVNDKFMKELGANLGEGEAALILLVRDMTPDKVLPQIKVPGKVIQTSLDNESEQQLSDALAAAGSR
jgi:uncharacterized membrane protein